MPLMNWNEKMSVGIDSIDAQHKKLVGMLNDLYDGIMSGHGKDVLGKILDGLVLYTKEHFAYEEKFFDQTHYADTEGHKHEHHELARQVLEVQEKYKSGAISTLSLDVMHFLKGWLTKHIQVEDMKYSAHLKHNGVK